MDFCDELIIADHNSKDGTQSIARTWSDRFSHVKYRKIDDPSQSQDLIAQYYGEDVCCLQSMVMRYTKQIDWLSLKSNYWEGSFLIVGKYWGKVLHCDAYEEETKQVFGYLARPSRSMTKLYNFSLISDWEGPHSERLHGGEIVFKKELYRDRKDHSESELEWENAVFRCLHMVFLKRSSLQNHKDVSRPNIAEINAFSKPNKLRFRIMRWLGVEPKSKTKHLTYMRGERVKLDAASFFSNNPRFNNNHGLETKIGRETADLHGQCWKKWNSFFDTPVPLPSGDGCVS